MSFLGFLCLVFWEENRHVLGGATSVMIRDRGCCSSPVCSRRDLQAHHLRFRSHGGGDDPRNLAGLCFRCHLRGVHEGRLSATGFAGRIRWVIGRVPLLVVEGREKRAA